MGVALLNTRFLSLQEFERGYFWSFPPRNGITGINSLYFLVFILRHLRLKQPLFSAYRILAWGSSSPSQAASRARRKKKSTEKTSCCQGKNKNGGKKEKGRKSSWEVNNYASGGMNSLQKWLSGRQGPLFICPIGSSGSPRASGDPGVPKALSEVQEVKTISVIILRCCLSFAFLFYHKWTVEFCRSYMKWDIPADWMWKQII